MLFVFRTARVSRLMSARDARGPEEYDLKVRAN
jgi:hypothetical protein